MFLWRNIRGVFAGQFEIHLGWLARIDLLIVQGRFNFAIHEENDFVICDWQIADPKISTSISPDNLLEIVSVLRCDVDFSASDWLVVGIFNDALNSGITRRGGSPCRYSGN